MDINDIKKLVLPIIKKFAADKGLLEKFKADPAGAVRAVAGDMDLGGLNLNEETVQGVVNVVKSQLGGEDGKLDLNDLAGLLGGDDGKLDMNDISGLLGKAKDLLGNKND